VAAVSAPRWRPLEAAWLYRAPVAELPLVNTELFTSAGCGGVLANGAGLRTTGRQRRTSWHRECFTLLGYVVRDAPDVVVLVAVLIFLAACGRVLPDVAWISSELRATEPSLPAKIIFAMGIGRRLSAPVSGSSRQARVCAGQLVWSR
jgi:hypothetical protein